MFISLSFRILALLKITRIKAVLQSIDKADEIAQQVAEFVQSRPELNAVYIAAPLEEINFISKIQHAIAGKFPIYTGKSLQRLLKETYQNCPELTGSD